MSNSGLNDGIDGDLIDLDSFSSGSSSGKLYVQISGVLRRAGDTIDRTDELLGSTRYLLRSRRTKPHTEPQPIQHPEHQQNTENPENQQLSELSENQQYSEPPEHQQNTENSENQQLSELSENQQYSELPEHRGISRNPNSSRDSENLRQQVSSSPLGSRLNLQDSTITQVYGKMDGTQASVSTDDSSQVGSGQNVNRSSTSVEQALRLLPVFDGTSSEDVHRFLRACDFAVRIIDPGQISLLVQGMTVKLSGRALRAIRYKEIETYRDFRKAIVEMSDKKKLLPQL